MNKISDDIIKKYLEGDCSEEDFLSASIAG